MRRTWPIPTAIAVIGALAGILIAGRSDPIDTLIIGPAVHTSSDLPSTITSLAPPVTVTSPATTVTPTASTTPTTAPPTTVGPTTSLAAPTTTAAPVATTAPATTNPSANQTLDPADVRVVVANGDGRFNLAGKNGSRLQAAGYTQIDLEDAAKVPATVLYYRPGFDDEAALIAQALLVPDALLEPLPDTPITSNDALGDVVVVLGPDAVR